MTMPTKWTAERDAELRRLLAAGRSGSQVGEALGVSRNAIIGRATRLGITERPAPAAGPTKRSAPDSLWRRLDAEGRAAVICDGQDAGRATDEIAAELGASVWSVLDLARKIGRPFTRGPGRVGRAMKRREAKKRSVALGSAGREALASAGAERANLRLAVAAADLPATTRFLDRPAYACGWIDGDPKAGPITELMCCGRPVSGRPSTGHGWCEAHRAIGTARAAA